MELHQRAAGGETRPPTAAELPERAAQFRRAIFGEEGSPPSLRRATPGARAWC